MTDPQIPMAIARLTDPPIPLAARKKWWRPLSQFALPLGMLGNLIGNNGRDAAWGPAVLYTGFVLTMIGSGLVVVRLFKGSTWWPD